MALAACASSTVHSLDQPSRARFISRSRVLLPQWRHGEHHGASRTEICRGRCHGAGHQLDDFIADAIISQLLLLDAMDSKKDIRMFINCPGGSVSAAMGIYDAIQLCRAEVSTIAFGLAVSTASVILAGGTKGKRFAMPNTRIMVHQPMGGASGQAIDVEIQAKEIMFHKNEFLPRLQEKDIDRDRYMSAVEEMEYGLIDGVIDQETTIPVPVMPEKKLERRSDIKDAEADPMKFLKPQIPDDEVFQKILYAILTCCDTKKHY